MGGKPYLPQPQNFLLGFFSVLECLIVAWTPQKHSRKFSPPSDDDNLLVQEEDEELSIAYSTNEKVLIPGRGEISVLIQEGPFRTLSQAQNWCQFKYKQLRSK